jgi:competence protein ComEC
VTPIRTLRRASFLFLCLWFAALPLSAADLRVRFYDCGQGDAALVRTPSGRAYLIDAGPNDRVLGEDFDAGEDVILPDLKALGVKELRAVVVSHPHLDHYGGALTLLERFPVRELIDPGWPVSSPHYLKLLQTVERKRIAYRNAKEGETLDWDPAVKVEVLGPREKPYARSGKKENLNNRSVVLKITYGKIAFLFTGDAEREAEKHLVKTFGPKLKATVLKAPHHGSKTSSTAEFLKAVRPETVVISCGRRNSYRHPHPGTMARFGKFGIRTVRTDLEGSVDVTTDGKTYRIEAAQPRRP